MTTVSSLVVRRRLASMRHVDEALARQVLHGGDVVTNLLEVAPPPETDEAALTRALADALGVAPASAELMRAPDPSAVARVPREVAAEHGIVPIAFDGGAIVVALAEALPTDTLEAFSSQIGAPVSQVASPLVRLRQALELAYGVPMDRRSRRLVGRLDGREREEEGPPSSPRRSDAGLDDAIAARGPLSPPPSDLESKGEPAGGPGPGATTIRGAASSAEALGWFQRGAHGRTGGPNPLLSAPVPAGETPEPPPASSASGGVASQRRWRGPFSREDADASFARAVGAADVLDATLRFAVQYFTYTALFVVHDDLAEGWDAHGPGASRDRVRKMGVPLDLPSSFAAARAESSAALRAQPPEGLDAVVLSDLERQDATSAVILPVGVRNRTVALLYGDDGSEPLSMSDLHDVIAVANSAGTALARLIIQRKLKTMGAGETTTGAVDPSHGEPARVGMHPHSLDLQDALNPMGSMSSIGSSTLAGLGASPRPQHTPADAALHAAPVIREGAGETGGSTAAQQLAQVALRGTADSRPALKPRVSEPYSFTSQDEEKDGDSQLGAKIARLSLKKVAFGDAPVPSAAPDAVAPGASRPIPLPPPPGSMPRDSEAAPPVPPPDDTHAEVLLQRSQPSEPSPPFPAAPSFPPFPPSPSSPDASKTPDASSVPSSVTPHIANALDGQAAIPAPDRSPAEAGAPAAVATVDRIDHADRGRGAAGLGSAASLDDLSEGEVVGDDELEDAVTLEVGEVEVSEDELEEIEEITHFPSREGERREHYPPRQPPAPSQAASTQTALPKVILALDPDVEILVERALGGGADADGALAQVGALRTAALPELFKRFPGDTRVAPTTDVAQLPAPREIGRILGLIAKLGDATRTELVRRLGDPSADARYWATYLLRDILDVGCAPELLRVLLDDAPTVRRMAISATTLLARVSRAGADAIVEALVAMLVQSEDPPAKRVLAADALAALREVGAVEGLVLALDSPEAEVREAVQRALVAIAKDDPTARGQTWGAWWTAHARMLRVEWLLTALLDDDLATRERSAAELKELTQVYFGYYASQSPAERLRAYKRYVQWWEEEGRAKLAKEGE